MNAISATSATILVTLSRMSQTTRTTYTGEGHALLQNIAWQHLGTIPIASVAPARLELHWAAQAVAAVANSLLPHREDDSQSSFTWAPHLGALLGQPVSSDVRAGLRFADMALLLVDGEGHVADEEALPGKTLPQALSWFHSAIAAQVGKPPALPLALRDYDMPDHPVRDRAAFTGDGAPARVELARWFENAHYAISVATKPFTLNPAPRCWPHHFDLATLIAIDLPEDNAPVARTVGVGLSPGDASNAAPYFYVSPWPRPDDATAPPPLSGGGEWKQESWFGAILPAERLVSAQSAPSQAEQLGTFLRSALAACFSLMHAEALQDKL